MKRFAAIALALLGSVSARADVKLPAIFGDHMVLQREMKVPIWGMADPGEKVTVKIGQQEQSATADEKSKWRVALDPIASADPVTINIAGKNSITLSDVLIGEVWLCSGQSNMEFKVIQSANGQDVLASADRPKLRLFIAEHSIQQQPQEDVKSGRWMVCSSDTAKSFSAVGYFFGVELQEKLNAPIGLIESNWGGTRAEAWTPKETFERLKLPYEPQWTEEKMHPKPAPGDTKPAAPRPSEQPSVLYNGMIAPLAGYAMRGVIWYQGESNAPHPGEYDELLSAMITSWRQAWSQGDFPFLIVQLAGFDASKSNAPSVMSDDIGGGWPALRDAQTKVARELPNTGLAVTIDIGASKDIHPKNKRDVGHRLAVVAEKMAYKQDVEFSGPTFKSLQVDGAKAVVSFDHADGMMSKGDALLGFEIAGEDGMYSPATAKIDGDKVELTSEKVPAPKAVRYGWDDDPKCTLYNKADLPAVPFATAAK